MYKRQEQQSSELERAIDQTVVACTDMAKTRTGVLIVFERKLLLDDMPPQRRPPLPLPTATLISRSARPAMSLTPTHSRA